MGLFCKKIFLAASQGPARMVLEGTRWSGAIAVGADEAKLWTWSGRGRLDCERASPNSWSIHLCDTRCARRLDDHEARRRWE
jgi:hypothetical protein